jgi:hypothetical protein
LTMLKGSAALAALKGGCGSGWELSGGIVDVAEIARGSVVEVVSGGGSKVRTQLGEIGVTRVAE